MEIIDGKWEVVRGNGTLEMIEWKFPLEIGYGKWQQGNGALTWKWEMVRGKWDTGNSYVEMVRGKWEMEIDCVEIRKRDLVGFMMSQLLFTRRLAWVGFDHTFVYCDMLYWCKYTWVAWLGLAEPVWWMVGAHCHMHFGWVPKVQHIWYYRQV